jgi:cytoskeletal protein RodZ
MFNFINIKDAKGFIPIALVALAGVAAYYLWTKAQANSAAANAANNTADANGVSSGDTTTLADLALLQSLMAGSGTGSTTQLSSDQPTYTSPGSLTGSNAVSAPVQQPITTSGSSTGNTSVTQGV